MTATARRLVSGALAVVAVFAMSTGISSASAAPTGVAYVRAAHLSPDTPKVDVYLTAFSGGSTKLWLSGVGYGDFSAYRRMKPGQYAVSMRPHGAKATSAAALSWTVALKSGRAYTAAAYGQGGKLNSVVFDDQLAPPATRTGYVRIVQGSGQAGPVKAQAGGKQLASNTRYGTISHYVALPAGSETLTVSSRADSRLTKSVKIKVASRSVTSVVVLDKRQGGLVLRPLVDAAGTAGRPSGGVETGAGGTAPRPHGGSDAVALAWILGAVGVALMVGVGTTRRRLRTA